MKATGIVRKVDELGRIVIPIELRRTMDISEKDSMEIYLDRSSQIVLKKHSASLPEVCVFCGIEDYLIQFRGKGVCSTCLEAINEGIG